MTPIEKAKELVDAMGISISYLTNYTGGDDIPVYANQYAKHCASIGVDEIINTLSIDIRDLDVRGNILLDLIDYWNAVKAEINKL